MRRVEELGRLSGIQCIFIDLDGTLLRKDKTIAEESVEELLRLQRQGIHLVIATGRPRMTVPVLPEPLHIDYYITSNGSMIYDHEFRAVYQKCMEPSALLQVMGCFTQDYLVQYFIEGIVHLNRFYLEHIDDYDVPSSNRASVLSKGVAHEDFRADYEREKYPCEKINILFRKPFDRAAMLALRDRIRQVPGVATVSGGVENLEVTDAQVNKAEAVMFVLELLGIDSGRTVGFGDSDNDRELFTAVKYGIAMENACEALKEKSAAVTRSNEDGGVAYALRCLFG